MPLSRLDLNLVVALRALLEERNVTRAGERVGLSQPAMSAALSRPRRHFDDELLARSGNSYELTPLAVALRDRSATACDLLERVFSGRADFDPAAESREFTLLASDYGAAVFGSALAHAVHHEAPGIRLAIHSPVPRPRSSKASRDIALVSSAGSNIPVPRQLITAPPTSSAASPARNITTNPTAQTERTAGSIGAGARFSRAKATAPPTVAALAIAVARPIARRRG